MNSRKPLVLIVSVVLAALSAFVLWSYVKGLQDKAFDNAERVKVYLVKPGETVKKGVYGQQTTGIIVQDEIPKKWYPSNAITSLDQIQGKVAVADMQSNQIVLTGNFVDPATTLVSLSAQLKQINKVDQVAVSIQVDQVRGVAGLIVPGNYVNLMVTKTEQLAGDQGDGGAGADCAGPPQPGQNPDNILFCKQARYVYQKIEVLAVGQTATPQPGDQVGTADNGAPTTVTTGNTGLITFIVPAKAAQYIASLPQQNIYLTLVGDDYKPVAQTPIKADDPLPAEDATKLTPYGEKGPE